MKKIVLSVFFLLICAVLFPQNNIRVIPGNVYVGDPAALIITLPPSQENLTDIVLMPGSPGFPYDPDIDFRRILLERRINGGALIVEFAAFVPGHLRFPDIYIGDEYFGGITVTINSVINSSGKTGGSALELSGPAAYLAMPGTALMLYGIMAAFVFAVVFALWFILRGRFLVNKLAKKLERRRHFSNIKKTVKSLHKMLQKGENGRYILDKMSNQFRIFLSFVSGSDCRSLTACEFENIDEITVVPLGNFFRRLDKLRFSGGEIFKEDIAFLLGEMNEFVSQAEKAKKADQKNNSVQEGEAA